MEDQREKTKTSVPQFDLTGKSAIVTGATSGIGRAIAETYAAYGANVVVAALEVPSLPTCDDVARKLMEDYPTVKALGCPVDVSSMDDLDRLVATADEAFGDIDILVNCAGIGYDGKVLDVTERDWDRVMDIDLKAVFFLCQKTARVMIDRRRQSGRSPEEGAGVIINLSSYVAQTASRGLMPYMVAKAGVQQMSRGLALEWAREGIRVNAICPGYVHSAMTDEALSNPKVYEALTSRIPHPRKVADPMDIAAAALYLACDASDMVTGHPLFVDGGRSVW